MNAPAMVSQLRTQLVACAGWKAPLPAVHYPKADLTDSPELVAVLSELSREMNPYAAGAYGLLAGELQVTLHKKHSSIAEVETLGRTILDQLLQQQSGIPFRTVGCGLSSDPTSAQEAGDSDYVRISLTLGYGLDA